MNEDIVVKTFKIGNDEFYVVKEVVYNNKRYVYLSNVNNVEDNMIRRINNNILEPLDSKEELYKILEMMQ